MPASSSPVWESSGVFIAWAMTGAVAILLVRGLRWRTMLVVALSVSAVVELLRWIVPAWTGSPTQVAAAACGAAGGGAAAVFWRRIHPQPQVVRPLRVLIDLPRRSWKRNPYIQQLIKRLPDDIEVVGFTHRFAVFGSYDLVHSHWPKHRLRSTRRLDRARNRLWWLLWMVRLQIHGIPVVKTRHNRRPHDPGRRLDGLLLKIYDTRVRAQIWLTEFSLAESGTEPGPFEVVIPHGDYRPWIHRTCPGISTSRITTSPIQLLTVGIIRRYKNIEEAVAAVSSCDEFRLSVAGQIPDPSYAATLAQLSGGGEHVSLAPGRVDDRELIELVLACDAVLIPYKDLYNSGVVFLALSLGRPVIVREGPAARELLDEYGSEWIGTYSGTLTPNSLREAWCAVASTEGMPNGSPQRAWPSIARAHAGLYRRVARLG